MSGFFLTRELLGVPEWFRNDHCTGVFSWDWVKPCCDRHDWDYWLGSSAKEADDVRAVADSFFVRNMMNNAEWKPNSKKVGWWKRKYRKVVAMSYWYGVRNLGESSFRIREKRLNEFDPNIVEVAKRENKYRETVS